MEPQRFIAKWTGATLKERSAAQEHFIDLCRLLGEPTPAEADPVVAALQLHARLSSTGPGSRDIVPPRPGGVLPSTNPARRAVSTGTFRAVRRRPGAGRVPARNPHYRYPTGYRGV